MTDRSLALLRFDFVLEDDVERVVDALEDRFGEPVDRVARWDVGDRGRGQAAFEADSPGQLGLPGEFDSLTIRVIESTDAVAEVLTLATIDEDRLPGAGSAGSVEFDDGRIRDWETRLGTVRSFVPGTPQGPETTVFWIGTDSLPGELAASAAGLEGAHRAPGGDELDEFLATFDGSAGSGHISLGDETLVVPRDAGRPWGTLLAIDLDENLGPTISSGGRQLFGPWADLSTLYAVHYWCRVRGKELEAFESELERAESAPPPTAETPDPADYEALAATIHELQARWIPLRSRVAEERRQVRRRLDDHSSRVDEGSRRRVRGDSAADTDLLGSYLQQLADELERARLDAGRLDDRLDSLAAAFQQRVSFVATRQTVELRSRLLWLTAAVVSLALVLVADVLMTGGLEAFVDRLFDEGLAAFTPQVLVGVVLLLTVAAMVIRRRW